VRTTILSDIRRSSVILCLTSKWVWHQNGQELPAKSVTGCEWESNGNSSNSHIFFCCTLWFSADCTSLQHDWTIRNCWLVTFKMLISQLIVMSRFTLQLNQSLDPKWAHSWLSKRHFTASSQETQHFDSTWQRHHIQSQLFTYKSGPWCIDETWHESGRFKYYEMILCYANGILCLSHNLEASIKGIQRTFKSKDTKIEVPTNYLVAQISQKQLAAFQFGRWILSFSTSWGTYHTLLGTLCHLQL
jgi:hypothetical protein